MKKIVKNAIFIVILIVIAMSIFNISYAMLNTGNFSKLATIKNTTIFTLAEDRQQTFPKAFGQTGEHRKSKI